MALPHVNPLDLISDIWANSVIDAVNAQDTAITAINAKPPTKLFGVAGSGVSTWSALTTLTTLTVPAQTVAGTLWVTADIRIDCTDVAGQIEIHLKQDGASTGRRFLMNQLFYQVSLTSRVSTTPGAAKVLTTTGQRIGGAGTCNSYGEPGDVNRIQALWIPS